jgi:hypothetical protein
VTQRDRTVVTVVVVLAAIVASWLLFIAPERSQAGRLEAQISSAQRQLAVEQSAVAAGESARHQYASYYAEVARLGEAVPSDDEVPSLIYQLQSAAEETGIDFRSLALSPGGAGTGTTPATSASSAATTGTTAAAAPALPPGVSEGPGGLAEEPFTLTFNGSFFHLAAFLGRLQRFVTATDDSVTVSGRLMTLNSVSFSAGPAGFPQISASISATTYLIPGATLGSGTTTPSTTTSAVSSTGTTTSSTASATPSTVAPSAAVTSSVR